MKYVGLAIVFLSLFLQPYSTIAQLNEHKPQDIQDVGVTEQLGEKIPLDITFANSEGDSVTLAEIMSDGKPVLLNPVYYECPQLCSMVKEAIYQGVRDLKWSPGQDYNIVTFSIDPEEKHPLAAENKQEYLTKLDRRGTEDGWFFLTGDDSSIKQLTESVGFNFKQLDNEEFAHGATVIFLSPEGTITRYLYGLEYDEFNMRNALYEAADGEIGSTAEQVLLYCYQYDADSNSYTPVAWRIMRLGGFATVLILGIFLGFMWIRHRYSNNVKQTN